MIERARAEATRYPGHAPTHALLGAARLLQLGSARRARMRSREAIWINPFDPDPHCNLVRATDDSAEIGREQKACAELK